MKVLIADDHPMVRDALARTVQSIQPDAQILQAQDYAQTLAQLAQLPDLALLDLNMPGMDGIAGIRRLRAAHPSLSMVVASGESDPVTIRNVLATGVAGFLPKAESTEVFVHALRLVMSGGVYTPACALSDFRNGQPPPRADAGGLTARQFDVLRQLMQGHPNKEIARNLGVEAGTVRIHIAAILRTLQARNRTEAVVIARKMGIGG